MNTSPPPTSTITPTTWWYASGQQKYGPYTETELYSLAREGAFQANDLVWNSNLDDWVEASSIGNLVFGTPVAQSLIQEQAQPAAPEVEKTTPEATQKKQLAHFVGVKQDFYLRNWADDALGFSWNWAAFFLGLFWLAYRKIYWACAILVGFATLVIGTALQMKIPLETVHQWQPYFMIFNVALGLFGNRLYLLHAKHKIRQINAQHPPENALRELKRQGGVSIMSVLHVVFSILLCSMLLGAVFGQ